MLKEVLFRRFSKVIKEKAGALSLPDLVMVDGGKGRHFGDAILLIGFVVA